MDGQTRAESTKQLLTASLKRLMARKPLDKITIREITDGCGVNRQTFYYHFQDIYDLVRWMYRQEAVTLLDRREGVLIWQDGLLQLFRYLEENREPCLCALHSLGHEHLRKFFREEIYDIIYRSMEQLAADNRIGEREKGIMTQFYVSALAGAVESWLLGDLSCTPEELVAAADRIIGDLRAGAALRLASHAGETAAAPSVLPPKSPGPPD